MITYTNSLDFCPGGVPLFVRLSQYDSNFSLVFNCFSHKGDFTVENGSTAVFRENKPDGNVISIDATVSGTMVTLTPSADNAKQMTAIKGHCECEISLQKNGKELSSANFVLLVEKAPVDIDAIQSDSVIRELYDVADRADDILEAAQTVDEAISDLHNLIDSTLTLPNHAADAKKTGDEINGLKSALNDLAEEVEGGGLSESAKQALLDCFANVVWAGDDGRTYYDALEDALYPDTGLVSISAVFDPGQNVIYTDTQLNELKAYLTVTGYYAGGAVKTIRAYTLSGTLTEGQSTVTVSFEGKTTTFTATVASALDRIAYDTLTYRDMFITNNFIKIGNFDDITISTELVTLPNGDTYRINNGSPVISQDACVTGDSSLKVSIDSMSSQVNYKSTRMPASAKFLMAACVRVDDYTSGNVGMQVNVSSAGLSASMIGHTTKASTTDGFEEIVAVGSYTYDAATHPDANLNIFIGDYTQGYATAYIDACIATIVPSGMTLQEATQLYHDYIQMVKS